MTFNLSELCSYIARGITPKYSEESNFCVLNQKCIRNNLVSYNDSRRHDCNIKKVSSDKTLQQFDILINSTGVGTAGRLAQLKKIPGLFSAITVDSHVTIVRPNPEKVYPEYLGYYLQSKQTLIESLAKGSTGQTEISRDSIAGIKIDLPNLENQKKIVKILSTLDQKIELNNKICENILNIAHQIYIKIIKSKDCSEMESLGNLCKIKYGKGLPTSKILDSGYRVYGGNGVIGFYREKMYDDSQVLISCRGAASGKVIFTRPECFVTNNSLVLECDKKYHYFIKEFSLDREYYDYATGSAQPQITIDNIKDIKLSVPDDETLEEFNNILRPLEQKYFSIFNENETLTSLHNVLLPKLMSGEISLEKAVIHE